ncbi:c-type cytochrome [Psychroserpens sp. NJDZ02]|uniref:c-type cytochrome n=1 Tax=Psychroserpens sp. NJDZ02 TaxID=2570561 RepID=UPI0010A7DBE5|nr:c-type cytochrome [Psychroserpens sp. NJDZ02]QCE40253.1 c-type cytochrome [Psychroserpens sp. NJDZ02]
MKQYIYIRLFGIATVTFLTSFSVNKNISIYTAIPTAEKNILVAYGQKIYTRELCSQCHTQQIKNQTQQLISLDGLGEKYSNEWLFYFINDPQIIVPNSKMPAYPKLKTNQLKRAVVVQIATDKKLQVDQDTIWETLTNEAQVISKSTTVPSENNTTEILALIAYLQQIPMTPEFEKITKTRKDKLQKEIAASDKKNLILKIANDANSIELGERIYNNNCHACHGQFGQGGIGPNLTDNYSLHGGSKKEIAKVIQFGGTPGKGMIAWRHVLSPEDIGQVTAYVYALKGTNPDNAKIPEGEQD